MARMNARMMRGKMALEVAAEIYSRHMFSLGNVVTVSINRAQRKSNFPRSPWGSTAMSWEVCKPPSKSRSNTWTSVL